MGADSPGAEREFSRFKDGGVLYLTMDDLPPTPGVAIVRVDINQPVKREERLLSSLRLKAHSETINELSEKGWVVLVLAHQGRPGRPDFVTLRNHARVLAALTGKKVVYPWEKASAKKVLAMGEEAVFSPRIERMLKRLKPGDIFLFENIRLLNEEQVEKAPEEHARHPFLQRLKELFPDAVFIFDAFAAVHRPHMSIMGPMALFPVYAGRVYARELEGIHGALERTNPPRIMVCGGAKVEDSLEYIERFLKQGIVDKVLTCGVIGEVFLHAEGYSLNDATFELLKGLFHKEREKSDEILSSCLERAKRLLNKYDGMIVLPSGVAADVDGKRVEFEVAEERIGRGGQMVLPIGKRFENAGAFKDKRTGEPIPSNALIKDVDYLTAYRYAEEVMRARTVIVNGPAGVYEEKNFRHGTRTIIKALWRAVDHGGTKALIGGADIIAAMEASNISRSHGWTLSVGGKAFFDVASAGDIMGIPVIRALRDYTFRWHGERLGRMHVPQRANGVGERTPVKR